MYRKTFIEINTANLRHNVETLIHTYPGYGYYIGVIKGNVYGHGIASAESLVEAGMHYLAVSSLEEALQLREKGILIPILLLQPIHLEDIEEAIKNNVTITLSNFEYFKKLISLSFAQELKIHLKINSGFNRLGVSNKNEVKEIVDTLKQSKNLKLEGIYSHFMTSGRSDNHFDAQIRVFKESTSLVNLKEIPIVHFDRSLTLQTHEKFDFCTGVRIGIAMYGYGEISKHTKSPFEKIFKRKNDAVRSFFLKPAFSLYSEVIEIQKIKKGDSVGYGASFKALKDGFVCSVSIGYADGFLRKNRNGFVSIGGTRYQIISVDMGIVTVFADEQVHVYDKVELIGENIPAKEVATRCETTVYEILCAIKESVPRILR